MLPRAAIKSISKLINELEKEGARTFLKQEPVISRHWPSSYSFYADTSNIRFRERPSGFLIDAEVPGAKKEDISIEWSEDNKLLLSAEWSKKSPIHDVEETNQEEDKKYESDYRKVTEEFEFPCEIDHEHIKSHYREGLLSVWIPKLKVTEKTNVKKVIPIE